MIFTSLSFLSFYLLLLAALFLFRNQTTRQNLLLVASYIFYGWWNPAFIILIFTSSLWGWYLGLKIDQAKTRKQKSFYLFISLSLSLLVLAYYKYAVFLAENIFLLLGLSWEYNLDIILPVGISFFTFQTMSYGIDLKRGRIPVCRSLPKFMLFVAFFPQLVAGPIVRASEFLPQLERKIKVKTGNIIVGVQIFLGGAIQKVLFADNLSKFVDPVFNQPELYSTGTLWLSAFAYTLQIFCDFSGYSLMAIGIARTLGFELPENFRMPYISTSITEFWRRWHMSLSFWLRDYLYISLGGNRKGVSRTYLYLMITMLLGGLWHGASWNFILWGALHGGALAIHKLWQSQTVHWGTLKSTRCYRLLAWAITLQFVVFLWIPFRSPDFETTIDYFSGMLSGNEGITWMHPVTITVLIVAALWHAVYLWANDKLEYFPSRNVNRLYPQLIIGLALLFIVLYAPLNTSPFLYFQF